MVRRTWVARDNSVCVNPVVASISRAIPDARRDFRNHATLAWISYCSTSVDNSSSRSCSANGCVWLCGSARQFVSMPADSHAAMKSDEERVAEAALDFAKRTITAVWTLNSRYVSSRLAIVYGFASENTRSIERNCFFSDSLLE